MILEIFHKNGYNIQTNPQSIPQVQNQEQYARYIIELALFELFTFRKITNQNNWFLSNVNHWKHLHGRKEIWSSQKVFENSQKQIPKVLRGTGKQVESVLDAEEQSRVKRLIRSILGK